MVSGLWFVYIIWIVIRTAGNLDGVQRRALDETTRVPFTSPMSRNVVYEARW